jgi:hypothetical protein
VDIALNSPLLFYCSSTFYCLFYHWQLWLASFL